MVEWFGVIKNNNSLQQKLYNKFIIVLLITAIASSITIQWHFKNNHFQEFDSIVTYKSLQEFPTFANKINKNFYPDSNTTIRQLRDPFIKSIATSNLPYSIKSFFALPLSSTYSPLPGLIYGLCTYEKENWHSFSAKAIIINIIVFHAGIIFLFLFLLSITENKASSLFASIIVLFSYSFHHYTYHLGSTIWIFSSICCWLYCHQKYKDKIVIVSIVSAILLLCNYLIFIFWLAFFISSILRDTNYLKNTKKAIIGNVLFFSVLTFVLIVFYPPNSSFKAGIKSITEVPKHFYYILLNGLSWYNKNSYIDIAQFVIISIFIFIGIKKMDKNINKFYIFLTAILFLLCCFKVLDFSPHRQQLFLVFLLIIPFVIGVSIITNKINKNIPIAVISILIVVGTYVRWNSNQSNQRFDVNFFYVTNEKQRIINYTDYLNLKSEALFEIKISPSLIINSEYIFLSQYNNFEDFKRINNIKEVIILSKEEKISNQYFIAYNISNASFNMPNNLFKTTFILKEINAVP
jgi:hypothetical protein